MKTVQNFNDITNLINQDLCIFLIKSYKCSVCKPISERLYQVIHEMSHLIYELYIEDLPKFSGQYLVFSVPTILIYSKGAELLRESRFIDFNKIKKIVNLYQKNQI